ncbi:unnamed protein product [Cochlearia groenlandica]
MDPIKERSWDMFSSSRVSSLWVLAESCLVLEADDNVLSRISLLLFPVHRFSLHSAMERKDYEETKKAKMLDALPRSIKPQCSMHKQISRFSLDKLTGKPDKEIYDKLEDEFGETVLYAPKTAALWLTPVLVAGGAAAVLAYKKHRQRTNVHIMALNLIRGVSLTPKERERESNHSRRSYSTFASFSTGSGLPAKEMTN